MRALLINCGSSSLKIQIEDSSKAVEYWLQITEIHKPQSLISQANGERENICLAAKNCYSSALAEGFARLSQYLKKSPDIIAHRVVHGGHLQQKPLSLNVQNIAELESLSELAPLHNKPAIEAIRYCMTFFPDTLQIALFDTMFHATIPDFASQYALPESITEPLNIKRYGFHGLSHQAGSLRLAQYLDTATPSLNIISLHLGSGASVCAIKQGKSIDTSMGFTPVEGLIMGTRAGDLDPSIMLYLQKKLAMNFAQIDSLLNKESGLQGICQKSDMRDIHIAIKQGNLRAKLAFDMFCYRVKKYLGAYFAILTPKVDAIVFTAGVGENDAASRQAICAGLEHLGIKLDQRLNRKGMNAKVTPIHADDSKVGIYIIAADEQWMMMQLCQQYHDHL